MARWFPVPVICSPVSCAAGWRDIWENGLPGTVNSPQSGYRTAAEGKPLQRRRNMSMIAMDLKAIWEMSAKTYYLL